MRPLDASLLLSSGAVEGPFRRAGWLRLLVAFVMAKRPDLSMHKDML